MGVVATRLGLLSLLPCLVAAGSALSARGNSAIEPGTGSLLLRVHDEAGQPLVARVRIAPASFGERVRLGQLDDQLLTADANGARVALAAGAYALTVSRGPEWSLVRQTVRISAHAALSVQVVLAHQISLPGWRSADLHVHTDRSSDARGHGGVTADAIRAEGVEIAVATDHNQIGAISGIESLAGAEVTTWEPEIGHFNAFPLHEVPTWRATTPRRLFAELARDPAVFVQINHPRLQDHIGYFALGGFDGRRFEQPDFHLEVDGLEVWNGYDIERHSEVLQLLAEWRGWVARGRRLTATGGSDCHGARGHHPGYPRTYVPVQSAAELSPALKAGRAFVTNGPLLALRVQGKEPGETVHVSEGGRVAIELSVLAPDWMRVDQAELWAGERLVWHARIDPAPAGEPLRFTVRTRIALRHARTLHAVVHGGSGLEPLLGRSGVEPLAFTNPVYVARGVQAEPLAGK